MVQLQLELKELECFKDQLQGRNYFASIEGHHLKDFKEVLS